MLEIILYLIRIHSSASFQLLTLYFKGFYYYLGVIRPTDQKAIVTKKKIVNYINRFQDRECISCRGSYTGKPQYLSTSRGRNYVQDTILKFPEEGRGKIGLELAILNIFIGLWNMWAVLAV